jgi:hypothetical protein
MELSCGDLLLQRVLMPSVAISSWYLLMPGLHPLLLLFGITFSSISLVLKSCSFGEVGPLQVSI